MDNNTEQPIPKMDLKLSGLSDVAAIEYSRKNSGGKLDGSDLADAFEAGISWLWRHLHSQPPSHVGKAGYIIFAEWYDS